MMDSTTLWNEAVRLEVLERRALWTRVRRAQVMQDVRRIMREKKITHEALATRMNIHRVSVTQMLRGDQNISIEMLYRLADALEVPLTITFGDA